MEGARDGNAFEEAGAGAGAGAGVKPCD